MPSVQYKQFSSRKCKAALIILVLIFLPYKLNINWISIYFGFGDNASDKYASAAEAEPFIIDTQGCRILNVEPFTKDVLKFWKKGKPVRCGFPAYTVVTNLVLYRNYLAWKFNVSCCYRTIRRLQENPSNYSTRADWLIKISKPCLPIPDEGVELRSEFIQTECKLPDSGSRMKAYVTKDYHAVVIPAETHTKETRKKALFWNSRPGSERPPNVLIIGIDTVSRLHMVRSLPKTREFLSKSHFFEMNGYTKIGENTLPNLMGLLGNMSLDPVKYSFPCWRGSASKFDDCPLIWKNFSARNYVTAHIEDSPEQAMFNFAKTGFVEQPTSYYIRPLMVAQYNRLGLSSGCMGGVPVTEFLLRYVRDFAARMIRSKVPYFLLSWMTKLSHDDLNAVKTADELYLETLTDLVTNPVYDSDNTVLVFLSDHGFRHGGFRNNFMGFFEESLPFLFIRVPPYFRSKYPNWAMNLEVNQERLTSPLDLYETLVDILRLSEPRSPVSDLRGYTEPVFKKTYSLFERIPGARTCSNSRIPERYCLCGIRSPVSVEPDALSRFGAIVVSYVNSQLSEVQDKCAKFRLSKVISGLKLTNSNSSLVGHNEDYLVRVQVVPGKALFEARIREDSNGTVILASSRTNSYRGQSDCMTNGGLKQICYCVRKLKTARERDKYKW